MSYIEQITKIISNISINIVEDFKDIGSDNNKNDEYCLMINLVSMYICVLFILYYYVYVSFVNYLANSLLNSYRINPSLGNYAEYVQLKDIFYFGESFSINLYALIYLKLLFIIIATLLYILYSNADTPAYTYILCWSIFGFILLFTYFVVYSYPTIQLSNKNNKMMNTIYHNINKEYLENPIYDICNYFNSPDENSNKTFELNKCNDLNVSINNNQNVYNYIDYIYKQANIADGINKSDRITALKNNYASKEDDESYYDKIIKALFTNTILNYFMKNNLKNEASEFFSIENLNIHYGSSFDEFFGKPRINPILYIKTNNLLFFESNYIFTTEIKNIPKEIFYEILQDYNKIENNASNLVIDIINKCKYKVVPPESYYNYITYFMIILLIVYLYNISGPSSTFKNDRDEQKRDRNNKKRSRNDKSEF